MVFDNELFMSAVLVKIYTRTCILLTVLLTSQLITLDCFFFYIILRTNNLTIRSAGGLGTNYILFTFSFPLQNLFRLNYSLFIDRKLLSTFNSSESINIISFITNYIPIYQLHLFCFAFRSFAMNNLNILLRNKLEFISLTSENQPQL